MPIRPVPDRFLVAFSLAGEPRGLVRAVAEAVERQLGSGTVFLDEWFEHYFAGADADLGLQRIYGEGCDLAMVCVSRDYGGKPWTRAEHEAIRARSMQARASGDAKDRDAVLPLRVGDGEVEGIPFTSIVPDIRNKTSEEAAELIIERLRLVAPDRVPDPDPSDQPGWPAEPPELDWPMADHSGVREAIASLLTRDAAWQFLPVRGPSETGRSHISRQMLMNALRIPELACGRFDFKGGTDMDAEVPIFVQDLDVPLPPAELPLNDRLRRILEALVARRPCWCSTPTRRRPGPSGTGWSGSS
jgi:hypothetical protein